MGLVWILQVVQCGCGGPKVRDASVGGWRQGRDGEQQCKLGQVGHAEQITERGNEDMMV